MIDAGRLPLLLMLGVSTLLHGLAITGLPNLPWFNRPPDVFRLTRYVVRFAKPVPTSVPMLTQVAVADPVPIEPAPLEPVADLRTPKPIERVETRPERVVKPQLAPAPVKPVVPRPPEQRKHRTIAPRERVVARRHPPRPAVAPVEPPPPPVVIKPAPRRRAAPRPRSRTATRTTGHQAPRRQTAAVPQTVAPVPTRVAALPQPRQPSPAAALLQAQAEQEQDAIQAYLGFVFQSLESHKRYPRIAERGGLNGRVVLRFTVRRDGEVLNPEVAEITGHKSFGDAARQALRRVGQLPPFPSDVRRRELLVEVPITYRIDDR